MKKNVFLMLSTLVLIVVSCKKNIPIVEEPIKTPPVEQVVKNCSLTGLLSSNGTIYPISFDINGNILNFTTSTGFFKATYTASKITTEDVNGIINYQLDAEGKIVSEGNTNIFTYDSNGYLIETNKPRVLSASGRIRKFTWSGGNLVKIEETSTSSIVDVLTTTTLEYSTDIVPSSYLMFAFNPIDSRLYKFLGKQSKNLVSKATVTYSSGVNQERYEYTKDNNGNITKRIIYYNSGNVFNTGLYQYQCK